MNLSDEIKVLIKQAEEEELYWDFWKDHEEPIEFSKRTISGRIVYHLLNSISDRKTAERTVGLLVSFVARRALTCWFVYCDDEEPLRRINHVIGHWLKLDEKFQLINPDWFTPMEPMEDFQSIRDCRRQDTFGASSAVANAALYASSRDPLDAIVSLSDAECAFCVSPATTRGDFEIGKWLAEYVVPCACAGRDMTYEEDFAFNDFTVPYPMHRMKRDLYNL